MTNNNIIIYEDPIMGLFTLQDLIYFLESILKDNNENLDILNSILKNTELTEEDITSIIFKFDQSNNLKFIIDVLSNNL